MTARPARPFAAWTAKPAPALRRDGSFLVVLGGDFDVDAPDIPSGVQVFDLGVGVEDLAVVQHGKPEVSGRPSAGGGGGGGAGADTRLFGAPGHDAPELGIEADAGDGRALLASWARCSSTAR